MLDSGGCTETSAPITEIENAALFAPRGEVMDIEVVKERFSARVKRAAAGEKIVITVDGEPAAILGVGRPARRGKPFQADWELLRSMPMTPGSTEDFRSERDSGF